MDQQDNFEMGFMARLIGKSRFLRARLSGWLYLWRGQLVIISSRRKSSFKSEGRKEAMKIVDRRACLVNEQVTVVMYRFLYLGIIFTIDQSIGPGSDRTDLLRFT